MLDIWNIVACWLNYRSEKMIIRIKKMMMGKILLSLRQYCCSMMVASVLMEFQVGLLSSGYLGKKSNVISMYQCKSSWPQENK